MKLLKENHPEMGTFELFYDQVYVEIRGMETLNIIMPTATSFAENVTAVRHFNRFIGTVLELGPNARDVDGQKLEIGDVVMIRSSLDMEPMVNVSNQPGGKDLEPNPMFCGMSFKTDEMFKKIPKDRRYRTALIDSTDIIAKWKI